MVCGEGEGRDVTGWLDGWFGSNLWIHIAQIAVTVILMSLGILGKCLKNHCLLTTSKTILHILVELFYLTEIILCIYALVIRSTEKECMDKYPSS